MSIGQMREAIAGVYSGIGWKHKVSKMSDDQVTAIYLKFTKEGKFDHKPRPVRSEKSVYDEMKERTLARMKEQAECQQLSLW